jgi:hypothetical protein
MKVLKGGPRGSFGKSNALKKAAALAGIGLAGLALGYKSYDPTKTYFKNKWKKEAIELDPANNLMEDRATQLAYIAQKLPEHPAVEKLISVKYLNDGISAFVRTTDGNAYEFEIRPARFAKGHEDKRGVTEGVSKIACLDCDEVSTEAAWEKNGGFCPKCKDSNRGVAEGWEYKVVEIDDFDDENPPKQ